MTTASQRIPNFLGGVSQQADERKFPGQVRDALNVYPDPTLGLTKRPGSQLIEELRDAWIEPVDRSVNKIKVVRKGNATISTAVKRTGNSSCLFDGTGDALQVSENDALKLGTGEFEIEVDAYRTGAGTGNPILVELGNGLGYRLRYTSTNILQFDLGGSLIISHAFPFTLNTWYNIKVRRVGTTVSILIDDVVVANITSTASGSHNAAVGIGGLNTGASDGFQGYLDNVKITKAGVVSLLLDMERTPVVPGTYDNTKFFTIFRDNVEEYLCAITDGNVEIWSLVDGSKKIVTVDPDSEAYLSDITTWNDLSHISINDYTFICNRTKVVATQAAPSWTPKRIATIIVNNVEFATDYIITVNGTDYTFTTRSDYVTGSPPPEVLPLKLSEVTDGIEADLAAFNPVVVGNTITITHTSDINVKVVAGPSGDYLSVIQDSATSIAKVPEQAIHNRIIEVTNTSAQEDTYWIKFVAEDGVSGKGYWEETIAPNVSPGLDATTMPQALIRNSDGTFQVIPFDGDLTINDIKLWWEPRLVGDDTTNPHPSFVGETIQDMFFYNNRMGMLTEDNVVMSQAGEYFNFYSATALTQIASDPIDISASSVKPAVLTGILPKPQGLLLFSSRQQFLMEADGDVWSPSTVAIRTLSNYECDTDIHPVEVGAPTYFIDKSTSWVRMFEMVSRGQRENPQITDQTAIVNEWIPATIDHLTANAQNGLISMSYRGSDTIYMFRIQDRDDERMMSAWFKWKVHGNVMFHEVHQDVLYAVVETVNGYEIVKHNLTLSPSASGLFNSRGNRVDPYVDSWESLTGTYDSDEDVTKVYIPSRFDLDKDLLCVVGSLISDPENTTESGTVVEPEIDSDGDGDFFLIPGDCTDNYIYFGYRYRMEVELPRYFYRTSGESGAYEIGGVTTIARHLVLAGLSGDVLFSIQAKGRTDWNDTRGMIAADYYEANDVPMIETKLYRVPVYQKPSNYTMKIYSDNPFPVSLISMVWEGQYSPKFYGRQ